MLELGVALQVLAGDDASSSSGDSDFGDKVRACLQLDQQLLPGCLSTSVYGQTQMLALSNV